MLGGRGTGKGGRGGQALWFGRTQHDKQNNKPPSLIDGLSWWHGLLDIASYNGGKGFTLCIFKILH